MYRYELKFESRLLHKGERGHLSPRDQVQMNRIQLQVKGKDKESQVHLHKVKSEYVHMHI